MILFSTLELLSVDQQMYINCKYYENDKKSSQLYLLITLPLMYYSYFQVTFVFSYKVVINNKCPNSIYIHRYYMILYIGLYAQELTIHA